MALSDPVREQLEDAAFVHAVRAEVRPAVSEVVSGLQDDPLGGPDTETQLARLSRVLGGDRVRQGRAARLRLELSLADERAGLR